jgi:hypothetical protein
MLHCALMVHEKPMKQRFLPRHSVLPLVAAVACLSMVACYPPPPEPMYAPPPPPPPRALTVTPQRRQSRSQQDSDSAACQSMASGQATSSDTWAQIFTACMGGRGYLVQ